MLRKRSRRGAMSWVRHFRSLWGVICSPRKSRRSLLKPYSIASKPNSSYTHYLGRTTMKLDRAQTMLTQGANDAISCLGDAIQYTDVHIENSSVGGGRVVEIQIPWWGEYDEHTQSFNAVPYLSGYMLCYSKMCMQASFQYLAKILGHESCTQTRISIIMLGDTWAVEAVQGKIYPRRQKPLRRLSWKEKVFGLPRLVPTNMSLSRSPALQLGSQWH